MFVRQRAPALPADVRELLADVADSGTGLADRAALLLAKYDDENGCE